MPNYRDLMSQDGPNPMAQYMGDEARAYKGAADGGAYGGGALLGASLGAAPASGGISLAGLPPALLMLLLGARYNQQAGRMTQGQDMWNRTGMPGSPHDPGPVPGGGRRDY